MYEVIKGVLFFHDNAPAHRALATRKKLAYLGFQCLHHPPYSLDLAPSDYRLFPGRIKQLKDRKMDSANYLSFQSPHFSIFVSTLN
jgi:histone-lysine N-methyltransferase SETMAR